MATITFTVYGAAQTAGSKRSFVPLHRTTKQPFRNRQGGVVVSTVDDNPKGKDWKAAIRYGSEKRLSGSAVRRCAVGNDEVLSSASQRPLRKERIERDRARISLAHYQA